MISKRIRTHPAVRFVFRYALPFLSIFAALLTQGTLQRLVPKESDLPYEFFYLIAAFVSAWYGGYVPGALACVLTIVGFPLAAIRFSHMLPVDLGRLTLFVGVSLLISRVAQTQRRLREVLQTANGELDLRVQARTSELQSEITDRKLAEQKLRTQIERLSLLDEIRRAMAARQDLHSIFQAVVRSLEDSLQIDFACVCLYDAARTELNVTCVGLRSEALA